MQFLSGVDTRRFPAPWSVRELEHAFRVEDVNGQAVAYTYFRRLDTRACSTHDEARRIAAKGAYLLDLVNGLIAHVRCDVNSARRVKNIAQVRFAPDSGPQAHHRGLSAKCQFETHAPQQPLAAGRRASASRSCCRAELPRSPCRARR